MTRAHQRWKGWLAVLALVALLVVACGPEMATPTPKATVAQASPTTAGATAAVATAVVAPTVVQPTAIPVDVENLPVDPEDWHILGPADAAVTLIEYSDFQ